MALTAAVLTEAVLTPAVLTKAVLTPAVLTEAVVTAAVLFALFNLDLGNTPESSGGNCSNIRNQVRYSTKQMHLAEVDFMHICKPFSDRIQKSVALLVLPVSVPLITIAFGYDCHEKYKHHAVDCRCAEVWQSDAEAYNTSTNTAPAEQLYAFGGGDRDENSADAYSQDSSYSQGSAYSQDSSYNQNSYYSQDSSDSSYSQDTYYNQDTSYSQYNSDIQICSNGDSGSQSPVDTRVDSSANTAVNTAADTGVDAKVDTAAKDAQARESYMYNLRRKIKRHWFPPKMGEWHSPVATFTLDAAGNAKNPRILSKTNKLGLLEKSCLSAIEMAGNFGPLPAGMKPNQVITIRFDFQDYQIEVKPPAK